MTKVDLVKYGYVESGYTLAFIKGGFLTKYRSKIIDNKINKIVNYLEDEIRNKGSNEVLFYPLYDTGDPELGYQVITRMSGSNPRERRYLPPEGYFKINLDKNSPGYEPNYRYVLEHIVKLTIAGECAFVITNDPGNINTLVSDKVLEINNIMCAFNREGLLNIEEIYSIKDQGIKTGPSRRAAHSRYSNYRNYHIEIGGYSLDENERVTGKEWGEHWTFPFAWTKGRNNMDFTNYMSKVKKDNSRPYRDLRRILGL